MGLPEDLADALERVVGDEPVHPERHALRVLPQEGPGVRGGDDGPRKGSETLLRLPVGVQEVSPLVEHELRVRSVLPDARDVQRVHAPGSGRLGRSEF